MTAKQKVLERAPRWSEAQAARALRAAEPEQAVGAEAPSARTALLERAAALRARQPHSVDAAALVREGRAELEQRRP